MAGASPSLVFAMGMVSTWHRLFPPTPRGSPGEERWMKADSRLTAALIADCSVPDCGLYGGLQPPGLSGCHFSYGRIHAHH